jgi:hypothetical protein
MSEQHPRPIGLHFSLRRELSPKFVGRQHQPAIGKDRGWWVIGSYDLLVVNSFAQLEDLGRPESQAELENEFIGAVLDFTFFPTKDAVLNPDFVNQIQDVSKGPRFLQLATFTLSPATFRRANTPSAVLDQLDAAAQHLQSLASRHELQHAHVGRSLGAFELIVIVSGELPADVEAFNHFFLDCRETTLAQIHVAHHSHSPVNPEVNHLPENLSQAHAFASSEAVLAINPTRLNDYTTDPAFISSDEKTNHAFLFKARIDCGHDKYVHYELTTALQHSIPAPTDNHFTGDMNPINVFSSYPVTGKVLGFRSLAQLINKFWNNGYWRESNLIDSETLPYFKSDGMPIVGSGIHAACPTTITNSDPTQKPLVLSTIVWTLNESIKAVIATLEASLKQKDSFGKRYLPRTLQVEALEVVRAFKACVHRYEFLCAIRDLIPCFYHLAQILNAYSNKLSHAIDSDAQKQREEFQKRMIRDFRETVEYLQRAIRNRIDPRRQHPDPQLPITLSTGVSSIINGYSAALSVCFDVFRGLNSLHPTGIPAPTTTEATDGCASGFAACVCAGTQGRITATRVFANEAKDSVPFWLFDVSGLLIFRPHICMATCFHEVAELTDWLRNPSIGRSWRGDFITCIWKTAIARLFKDVQSILPKGMSTTNAKAYFDIACKFLSVPEGFDVKGEQASAVDQQLNEQLFAKSPPQLLRDLHAACYDEERQKSLEKISKFEISSAASKDEIAKPDYFDVVLQLLKSKQLSKKTRHIAELTTEIVADIGMIMALYHVLEIENPNEQCGSLVEKLRRIVCSVFRSAMEMEVLSRGASFPDLNAFNLILLRWAFHLACFHFNTISSEDNADRNLQEWERNVLQVANDAWPADALGVSLSTAFTNLRDATKEFLPSADGDNFIFENTSLCKCYGGPNPNYFAEIVLDARSVNVLHEFVKAFAEHDDEQPGRPTAEFGFVLWAKSQLFWPGHLLMPYKPVGG